MARRTKEEAQHTRETILTAALDTFCEKGYSRTTFDEIAKKINLTKGAVYWHFKNKPDIIKALIIEAFERNEKAINSKISEVKTLEDLQQYFTFAAEIVQNTPIFRKFLFFVMYQMERSEGLFNTLNISGPVNHIMTYHHELITKVLHHCHQAETIRTDIDLDIAAEMLHSMWEGTLYRAVSQNYTGDFINQIKQSFQILINSLKKKKDN